MSKVPEGWEKCKVSDICNLQNGNSFKPHEWDTQGLPIIRIQNLNGSSNFNYFSGKPLDKWLVETGQLLFSWAGTKGVSFGPFIWNGVKGVLNQHIYKVYNKDGINRDWLYLALAYVTNNIESKAHGFKSTLLHVQKKDIDNQIVLVPNEIEQQKIAKILSTWDKAISATEQLISNSQQQKKMLMQGLLTGKKRVSSFKTNWKQRKISHLFTRVTTKNIEKNENVVTISGQQGLIRQSEFFKKQVASEILDGYFLLQRGQFAYNKSYSNGYPMGAIKRLNKYEKGVVTTLYICFEITNTEACNSDFFEHYFESGLLNKGLSQIAHEGGRAHGLLNVKPADFFSLSVFIPEISEQQKIAQVLTAADREIELLQQKLAGLKQEKQALMQQLLTGKRRVVV
ncbi:restriction endonuclease subunit S [Buttiauxella gaviniae]|uniref:restriction endonuclease subunit S n=1 Tax=Buttiauxella gaviniae TaxID=82990 RepID=UPI003BB4FDE3